MKRPSESLFMALFLKSILWNMSIASGLFFPVHLFGKIFFQPFPFSLCKILSAVGLLEAAFVWLMLSYSFSYSMSFKVIIDNCLFIVIFFVPVFLSLSLFSFLFVKQSLQHLLQGWFGEGIFFRLLLSGKRLVWSSIIIKSLSG